MVITAVVDRIGNDCAVLISEGIEIIVPSEILNGAYQEGETLSLAIDKDGARVLITEAGFYSGGPQIVTLQK